MILEYKLDSPESHEAIAKDEPKHVCFDGNITRIYTGEDIPVENSDE